MPARDRRLDRTDRAARQALATLGEELRLARRNAGLSSTAVAAAARVSHVHVLRVERGSVPGVRLATLARLADAVGLRVSVRAFPAGDPIRDAAHVALLARFARRLHRGLRVRYEVPLPIAGDRRAWDAVVHGDGWIVHVEAETVVRDVQALVRKLELKMRDGGVEALVLLVADTRRNRAVLRAASSILGPILAGGQRELLGALGEGRDPGGGGIVVL